MKAIEIRKLGNGQYEVEAEFTIPADGTVYYRIKSATYRTNKILNYQLNAVEYDWIELPDGKLVLEDSFRNQLNAWLYDWQMQQKLQND